MVQFCCSCAFGARLLKKCHCSCPPGTKISAEQELVHKRVVHMTMFKVDTLVVRDSGGPDVLAPVLTELANTAIMRTEGHFLQGELYSEGTVRDQLEDGKHRFVVALANGKTAPTGIVAACRVTLPDVSGCDAHLSMVCVKEDFEGRGIGTALVEGAVKVARTAGCARVGLHFPSVRQDMQKFYTAREFVLSHEEPMPEKYTPLIKPGNLPMGLVWMYRQIS
eukprot:m.110464 g.110464  ORF g.110464 m.110464 type:complete len:222 (-) comp12886_c0_seq3:13-678(-)